MKKVISVIVLCLYVFSATQAQNIGIGTNTPNTSALLDINTATKGILIPRNNSTGILLISNPAKGLMVFDTSKNELMVNIGTAAVPNWQSLISKSWKLSGNAGINDANDFIGTTDNHPLKFRVNNLPAGQLTTATEQIFLGVNAGRNTTAGRMNIAIGTDALFSNNQTEQNIAIGSRALYNNWVDLVGGGGGDFNVAVGVDALYANTIASSNVAIGNRTMYKNVNGSFNTACGSGALYYSVSGNFNTSVGLNSMYNNTSGESNTAVGTYALSGNNGAIASFNTAVGYNALVSTHNSQYNTCLGYNAGSSNDMGYNNTILGANCGINNDGYFNCIAIGQSVICTGSSQARIGNASTNSIGGYAGWSNFSDGRFKKDVTENVPGINFIMLLRPVTYRLDASGISRRLSGDENLEKNKYALLAVAEKEKIIQTGFVAQEVEAAAKTLDYNFSGVDKPTNENDFYALRYAEFVVPLVKAMQEQQTIILSQKEEIETLKTRLGAIEQKVGKK